MNKFLLILTIILCYSTKYGYGRDFCEIEKNQCKGLHHILCKTTNMTEFPKNKKVELESVSILKLNHAFNIIKNDITNKSSNGFVSMKLEWDDDYAKMASEIRKGENYRKFCYSLGKESYTEEIIFVDIENYNNWNIIENFIKELNNTKDINQNIALVDVNSNRIGCGAYENDTKITVVCIINTIIPNTPVRERNCIELDSLYKYLCRITSETEDDAVYLVEKFMIWNYTLISIIVVSVIILIIAVLFISGKHKFKINKIQNILELKQIFPNHITIVDELPCKCEETECLNYITIEDPLDYAIKNGYINRDYLNQIVSVDENIDMTEENLIKLDEDKIDETNMDQDNNQTIVEVHPEIIENVEIKNSLEKIPSKDEIAEEVTENFHECTNEIIIDDIDKDYVIIN